MTHALQGAHGTWSPCGKLLVRTTFERRAVLGGAFAPAIELVSLHAPPL